MSVCEFDIKVCLVKFYNKFNNLDWEKSEFHIEANATVKLSRNHEKQGLVDTHRPAQTTISKQNFELSQVDVISQCERKFDCGNFKQPHELIIVWGSRTA